MDIAGFVGWICGVRGAELELEIYVVADSRAAFSRSRPLGRDALLQVPQSANVLYPDVRRRGRGPALECSWLEKSVGIAGGTPSGNCGGGGCWEWVGCLSLRM